MKNPSLVSIGVPLALLAASLTGCASPQARLASGLRSSGMGPKSAACLSHEMVDDLSLGQLIKLSKLGEFKERSIRQMSLTEFLKATRALQDPEILKIATVAAAVCTIKA